MGLVMPGDVTLLVAGMLASHGTLNLWLLAVIGSFGAIFGDSAGYAIGRFGGIKVVRRIGHYFRVRDSHLEKAQKYFDKHGGKTIFVGRFATGIKSFIPVAAGISRMNYGTFLLYNFVASILNVTLLLVLGYFFGESWQRINEWLGWAGSILLGIIIVAAAVFWYMRRRRREMSGEEDTDQVPD